MNSTKISECEFVSNAIHNNDLVDGLSEHVSETEYNEVNNGLLPLIIYPQVNNGLSEHVTASVENKLNSA